jgi:hypothetical protein
MTTTPAGPTTAALPAPSLWKDLSRFVVPFLLPFIVSIIAKLGFHVTLATAAGILTFGGLALGVVLRALEVKWKWMGALLGYIGAPIFQQTKGKLKDAAMTAMAAQITELLAQQHEATSPSAGTATGPQGPQGTTTPSPS